MGDEDDLDARLAALEREVADERTAAELKALEALRQEERELDELNGRLSRLQREHRTAVAEVLGGFAEPPVAEPPSAEAPRPAKTPRAAETPRSAGSHDTSVRLTVDLYARLDQLAGEQGRSVQALCADVLDGYMRSRKPAPQVELPPADDASQRGGL